MKTPVLIIIAISLSQLLFAQNDRFIEIAVSETVELNVLHVILELKVRTPEVQRKEAIERGDTAEFKIFTTRDLRWSFIERYAGGVIETVPKNPLDESEGLDSVVMMSYVAPRRYKFITEIIEGRPVDVTIVETVFESIENKRKEVIPEMTKKATQEAAVLASSMQKKIGEVIQCTNILPVEPTSSEMSEMNSVLGQLNRGETPDENSFNKTRSTVFSYLYRFELID